MINQTIERSFNNPKFWQIMVFSITLIILCQNLGAQTVTSQISNNNNLPVSSATTNPNSFISTWNTSITYSGSSNSTEITLPLISGGQYNFTVQWGDGSNSTITAYNQTAVTHNYPSPGVYTVNITGYLKGWEFNDTHDCYKITGISQWGNINLGNSGLYFFGCSNLVLNATDALNLTGTTDLSSAFEGCLILGGNGDINCWNVSNVTDMSYMFYEDSIFNQSLNSWNVSSVSDMIFMFADTAFNQNICNWNVSSVNNMAYMFNGASAFNQPIGNWTVSSVTHMGGMFQDALAFNQNIGNWNVSSVTEMGNMFTGDSAFSTENYGALLIGWSQLNVQSGVTFSAGSTRYPVDAATARQYLITNDSWSITDGGPLNTNSFISTWNTSITYSGSSSSSQITLPLVSTGQYNFTIQWGDGLSSTITAYNQTAVTHTYHNPDVYTVNITGYLKGWDFNNTGDYNKLIGISQWGNINLGNSGNYFCGCNNLVLNTTDALNLTGTTDLSSAFENCTNIGGNGDLNSWDVSNVANMSFMFFEDSAFNQTIGSWDVSNVANMSFMFFEDSAFNQPIGNWNVSSVIDMSYMFDRASAFNQSIGNWNVSSVTNMDSMFVLASAFNQPISNWDVAKVTDMSYMFYGVSAFNQPIGNWDVAKVTDMEFMFDGASAFNQSIGNWNVSRVTDMEFMFDGASAFNQSIGNWNVSSVTDMVLMFNGASAFNHPLDSWNVSSVKIMHYMFDGAIAFNQPIGNWDVSKVTDMSAMFDGAIAFNQPIGNWDVSKVTDMSYMFCGDSAFNQNIGNWNVSSVSNMECMFWNAFVFNQPIGNWNVSSVTSMDSMFAVDSAFNQSIGNWDVSSVIDMTDLFADASAFNQPIGNWNVSNVQYMSELFYGDSAFNQNIGNWNVSGIVHYYGIDDMFTGDTAFSAENYGFLLIGWSQLNVHSGLPFGAPSTPYPVEAAAARQILIQNDSWLITDGGLANASTPTLYPISSPSTTGIVTLDWSFSLTASSYSVYRSNSNITSLTNATMIATNVTDNSYQDTNLANGTYYYVILATNGVTNSSISNYENVSVIFKSSEPVNPTAMVETSSILLTWETPVNNGGSTIQYYNIYRFSSSNEQFALIGNTTTTSYNDNNIFGGLYYYKIVAVTEVGEGNFSNIVSATIILKPSAPSNFVAKVETNSILLTWESSSNNGGSGFYYYDIYRSDSANGTFTIIGTSLTASYNDINVVAGQTYYYEISAVDSAGESSFSNITSITPIFKPSPPTYFNATAKATYILLTWENPTSNGGSAIICYNIYRSNAANSQFSLIGNSTTTSYNDTRVTADQNYYYEVSAVNNVGESSFSNVINSIILLKPSDPTDLNVTAGTNCIDITWESPTDNGGSAILYYNVYRSDSANGQFSLIGISATNSYKDYNVTSNQTYYYEISAINNAGQSGFSNSAKTTYVASNNSSNNLSNNNLSNSSLGWMIFGIIGWAIIASGIVSYVVHQKKPKKRNLPDEKLNPIKEKTKDTAEENKNKNQDFI